MSFKNKKTISFFAVFLCAISILLSNAIRAQGAQSTKRLINSIELTNSNQAQSFQVSMGVSSALNQSEYTITYERDFAQIVFFNTSLKAAKVLVPENGDVKRVFLYPFQSDVTRMRLFFDKDSSPYKNRIFVSLDQNNSNRLYVGLKSEPMAADDSNKGVPLSAESQTKDNSINNVINKKEVNPAVSVQSVAEKKLLEEVAAASTDQVSEPASNLAITKESKTNPETIGIKNDPSQHVTRMILSLIAVIGFFLLVVYGLKRWGSQNQLLKFPLGKNIGKKERLIQVIATHRLGRNQAISLVKITGEFMVLGNTDGNISLITKLGKELDVEKYLEDRYWGGAFEKHLSSYERSDQESNRKNDQLNSQPTGTVVQDPLAALVQKSGSSMVNLIKNKTNQLKQLNH